MKLEFIAYPDYEAVFTETNQFGKYVFFPILSIHFKNWSGYDTKSFHIVSLWDTGNHGDCHFGKYRIDEYTVHFDLIDNKLSYKERIEFPKIKYLPQAYQIIVDNFENNKDEILANDDFNESNIKYNECKKGKHLILAEILEFGDFEAGHYFENVTAYLLGKYKSAKGIQTNPEMDASVMEGTKDDFLLAHDMETKLINNFLGDPVWLQGAVELPNTTFIGQVCEMDYLSGASADLYLFFDESKDRLTQIYQWS